MNWFTGFTVLLIVLSAALAYMGGMYEGAWRREVAVRREYDAEWGPIVREFYAREAALVAELDEDEAARAWAAEAVASVDFVGAVESTPEMVVCPCCGLSTFETESTRALQDGQCLCVECAKQVNIAVLAGWTRREALIRQQRLMSRPVEQVWCSICFEQLEPTSHGSFCESCAARV